MNLSYDHAACSHSVAQADHAFGLGAMLAAEKFAFLFEPVTDDMNRRRFDSVRSPLRHFRTPTTFGPAD